MKNRVVTSKRYIVIMRKVASKCSWWSEIKRALDDPEGRK
ncbi:MULTISPECIES: hypothetical protein [Sulfolobaceae]